MKKSALLAACLMVMGPVLYTAGAADGGRGTRKALDVRVVPPTPDVVGTVTYDTSVNAGFHPDDPNGANLNRCVGNRFNSALGGPLLNPGMVTMLTVFPANSGAQSVSVAGPPNTMGTAAVLAFVAGNIMANQFNAVTIAPVSVTADFIGWFLGTFNQTQAAGLLGMSDMQNAGQGYHAVQGFYVSGMGISTMVVTVPNRNAMLRATGNILVPVELMEFKIQ